MTALGSNYTAHVDEVTESQWSELLPQFDDASLYQSWSYGTVCWKGSSISHFVVKRNGIVVGMTQVRIMRLPLLGKGIAYVRWGPLWRLHGEAVDFEVLRQVMLCLRREYADRRRLLLRVVANAYVEEAHAAAWRSLWKELGFRLNPKVHLYRTMRVNLGLSSDDLRKGLHQRWRNYLKNAEKSQYTVVAGASVELYEKFLVLYRQMMERKHFDTTVDVDEFRRIQQELPAHLKMQVFVCEQEGRVLNALVVSAIGDSAIYLLAATGHEGLKGRGAYLLQWRAMEWLQARGCRWYDLGGINPDRNPGVYQFKSGMGGQEIHQFGGYDFSCDWINALIVSCAEHVRTALRAAKLRPLITRTSSVF